MNDHTTNAITVAASKGTYAGAAAAGLGWLVSNEFLGLLGLLLAVAGFVTNLHFKRRRDQREQLEHEARMREIQERNRRNAGVDVL